MDIQTKFQHELDGKTPGDFQERLADLRQLWKEIGTDNFDPAAAPNVKEELEFYSSGPLLYAQTELMILAQNATSAAVGFAEQFRLAYEKISKQLMLSARAIDLRRCCEQGLS